MGYTQADRNLALALTLQGADAGNGQISRLVGVARLLEAVPDPDIDPGFAARLEARLMREDVGLVNAFAPTPRQDEPIHRHETEHRAAIIRLPRRRRVVRKAIAATIAAALALALPVVAVASALPGSPGYGLKLRLEQLRIGATGDQVRKGFLWLGVAGNRLSDVQQLAALRRPRYIPVTLDRLERAQQNGASLILAAATDKDILAHVAGVLQSQNAALTDLLSEIPAATRGDLLDAIRTGRALSMRVAAALGLPMIRPPATVAPGAAGPEDASFDQSIGSDGTWAPLDDGSGVGGSQPPHVPGGGSEKRNTDATYMRCKLDPYRGPAHGDVQTAACPQSLTAPEVMEVIHFADHIVKKQPQSQGPSATGSCPNPKTCRLYELKSYRWPAASGVASVKFMVNPQQQWMSESRAAEAVSAATRVWTAANRNVRFSFGRTEAIPALGNSINEIAWVPLDPGLVGIASVRRVGSRILEADIKFNAILPWNWTPCAQRANTCSNVQGDEVIGRFDVQAIATHELGHAIGLGHLEHAAGRPESADLSRELSMYAQPHPGERKQATLGLGDVLAIRAAYPCKGCRVPPVYAP